MSKAIYDKYYIEQNYFGEPYEGLKTFFANYIPKGKVLDLGCGQGRDSIFLAKCGYEVTGVDISSVGINQMNNIAKKDKLNLKGEVADIYSYPISKNYDFVLLDSMLHFYKNDVKKETNLIERIAKELKQGGIICNFIIKGDKREKLLKDTLNNINIEWEVLVDKYVKYKEANAEYHMYVIKKKV